jgi:hypothetical protein
MNRTATALMTTFEPAAQANHDPAPAIKTT